MSYKNWCFTWNNYSDFEFEKLTELNSTQIDNIVIGKEIGEVEKTPHLQGYVEFAKRVTMVGAKKILDTQLGKNSPVHLERAMCKDRERCINYCKKGEQPKEEWHKDHEKGPNFGLNAIVYEQTYKVKKQGQRTDWSHVIKLAYKGCTFEEIMLEHDELAGRYASGIDRIIACAEASKQKAKLEAQMEKIKLRRWQKKLETELNGFPDDRKIIWYNDPIGNTGKSTMGKYLLAKGDTAYFTNSASKDISLAYKGEKTAIFDFTRDREGAINYSIIESIKNGVLFSAKYASQTKVYASPFVVIFANWMPDKSKMSLDRWDIRTLNKDDCEEFDNDSEMEQTEKGFDVQITEDEINGLFGADNIADEPLDPEVERIVGVLRDDNKPRTPIACLKSCLKKAKTHLKKVKIVDEGEFST